MLLSLNWLREFVPVTASAQEIGERLTYLGLELEDIHRPYSEISKIVVGEVVECQRHPQADKLSLCQVNVGTAVLPIVCGAPNVAAGQKVPVAMVGTVMPGGMEIKKAKLRGEESLGMICSERELGLSEEHNGILVLPSTAQVGSRLVDALGLDDEILEIGITPNRADCLSVLGLAREVGLAFNLPVKLPEIKLPATGEAWDYGLEVVTACPAYSLKLIENIQVQASPYKWRYRLHSIGVRPISNVVDITNIVLMELGQPLHAFDADKLQAGKVVVSLAQAGEEIMTLDGQKRTLTAEDLLIRDGQTPIAMAGVMGGLDSEITETSHRVLLECAIFDPITVRRTSKRLGLSSESSYRFERGVDQSNMDYAADRAASLMAELAGATVRPGRVIQTKKAYQPVTMPFRVQKANDLLGITVTPEFCKQTFTALGCKVANATNISDAANATNTIDLTTAWQVTAPGWRQDLSREVDLIEEVARVHGMDNIPETLPLVRRPLTDFDTAQSLPQFIAQIKNWGQGIGLNEVENYSFVGQTDLDHLGLPQAEYVSIINPLSEDQNTLRTLLTAGLLLNVRHNLAHGNNSLRLFEVAKIFKADPNSATTATEHWRLSVALHGPRFETWPQPDADFDFADIKGLIEHFCAALRLPKPSYTKETISWLSPGLQWKIGEQVVGWLGQVSPSLADAYHAKKPIWVAELDLDALRPLVNTASFKPLTIYPPAKRDITVMAKTQISMQTMIEHWQSLRIKNLESIQLIDLFEPPHSEERNLTFRLTFRDLERTLQDAEVDKARELMAKSLVDALAVRI